MLELNDVLTKHHIFNLTVQSYLGVFSGHVTVSDPFPLKSDEVSGIFILDSRERMREERIHRSSLFIAASAYGKLKLASSERRST